MTKAPRHRLIRYQYFLLPAIVGSWLLLTARIQADDFQGATHMMPFDEDTIAYSKTTANGPVEQLQRRIDAGQTTLQFEENFGYLRALLKELKAPESSQVLVFSKTSLQRERISPHNPRSLFFADDTYVGFIPGAPIMEITSVDPKLGGVFYTLEQKKVERPKFVRNDQCLECHASAKSMGVPGHLVRSFATDEAGVVDLSSGTSQVNHRTPFAERWGGWYVTGKHGQEIHRGNLIGAGAFERQLKEPNYLGNIVDLSTFFEVSRYLKNQSDIVALMVLEHQTHMQNFIARLNYETTLGLQQYGHIRYQKSKANAFLRYLLFTEEAPLKSPVSGSPEFIAAFAAQGPRDKQGRSLRDFDLRQRLFKHPCSYLIYSEPFDALPKPMKEHLYTRLHDILTGKDESDEFRDIPDHDRQTIREILLETKPDLAECWNASREVAVNDSLGRRLQ
jgi:hypothetical protein